VAIIPGAESVNLKAYGNYEITDGKTGKPLSGGRNLKSVVTTYKGQILIGGKLFNTYKVSLASGDGGLILIDGRRFRGEIQFIINSDAKLLVVNNIDLEDYVKGILYHEASHYWPMEALKAQAIVSRTYAVFQRQENKGRNFDVTSDIYSQVYGGRASERYRTNKAVEETKGIVLTFQGKVFPTYFHATCGGHTEDASVLWNTDLPPLKGVVCNFCRQSEHFKWHYVLSLEEIKKELNQAGFKIGNIFDLVVLNRDNSGRVTDLSIVSSSGIVKIPAKDFRGALGPNIIRSTNFHVSIVDKDAVFEGLGWGHGVGLCQWGAYFMSKQGYSAEQILKYYYPGTDVKTLGF